MSGERHPELEDYPRRYLSCKTCGAYPGAKCRSRSGRVVDGRPDEAAVELAVPHIGRPKSKRRPRGIVEG